MVARFCQVEPMSAQTSKKSNKWLWLALILGGIALIVLLSLGTWQVQRLAWKEALLATIQERTRQSPVAIGEVIDRLKSGKDIEYVPVTAAGNFDHENEQHFFATHNGNSGFYVYTPLYMSEAQVVFVNRGFVPYDRKTPSSRPDSLVAGTQTVTGLARSAPGSRAGWVVPDNDIAKNVFHWKDLTAMRDRAGLTVDQVVPMFIDQNDNADGKTLPVGGVTMINLPNNHLQYAITWYGLALTLIGVLGYYVLRNRREA